MSRPALPTRAPMARARRNFDTFTFPEGRRRRVYQPRPQKVMQISSIVNLAESTIA
jgi:hypothetical protein